jgi:hexosaminidase
MKRSILFCNFFLFIIFVVIFLFSGCKRADDSMINIIPKPVAVEIPKGKFQFSNSTRILVEQENAEVNQVAQYLTNRMASVTGYQLNISAYLSGEDLKNTLFLTTKGAESRLGDEGYTFKSDSNSIVLRGQPAGLFYSVQTLFQLLPPQIYNQDSVQTGITWTIPSVYIEDKPRFLWRGMHLDVGRHMFPVKFIKRYIDYLAMHKMNTFHWHLTEDQGWRIEIKKYPRLTEIGAYRDETVVGHVGKPHVLDGVRYGGYYTQDDVREIVQYAKERFITVVPEIEMPGHSLGALASYPHLSCTGGPFEVRKVWGITDDIYCAGNDSVFSFLEDVLTEVMALFPSEYIHIGGDEAPKERWQECPKCQKRIAVEGLKDEHELQSYFISRIERFLNSHGRQIIGWDEILEGGLAPNAAVMSWRGTEGGIAAAQQNHNVVMSPTDYCYFDYYQGDSSLEPLAIGGFLPLEKVYSFEPVPVELSNEQKKYILGAQGNVWTEYIKHPEEVEYMALPRMCALAEVVWSVKEDRNLDDFLRRMSVHYLRLDEYEINYRWPSIEGFFAKNIFIDEMDIRINKKRQDSEIRYTLDGKEPSIESSLYSTPIHLTETTVLKVREFLTNGRFGKVYQGHFVKQKPNDAIFIEKPTSGLSYDYYETEEPIDSTVNLDDLEPKTNGWIKSITFPFEELPEAFGLIFRGFIKVSKTGVYTFTLLSNDGSCLFINEQLIVDNDGWHGAQERYGQIALKAGLHPIRVSYFQVGGGKALQIFVEGPGIEKHEVQPEEYFISLEKKNKGR